MCSKSGHYILSTPIIYYLVTICCLSVSYSLYLYFMSYFMLYFIIILYLILFLYTLSYTLFLYFVLFLSYQIFILDVIIYVILYFYTLSLYFILHFIFMLCLIFILSNASPLQMCTKREALQFIHSNYPPLGKRLLQKKMSKNNFFKLLNFMALVFTHSNYPPLGKRLL